MSLFTRSKVVSGDAILAWIVCVLTCLCVFHVLIRSGWSRRFEDAALSQAQIVFAIFAVMAGYTATGAAGTKRRSASFRRCLELWRVLHRVKSAAWFN